MSSLILIRPTVWPQYTNVTVMSDRTGQDNDDTDIAILLDCLSFRPSVRLRTLICCVKTTEPIIKKPMLLGSLGILVFSHAKGLGEIAMGLPNSLLCLGSSTREQYSYRGRPIGSRM